MGQASRRHISERTPEQLEKLGLFRNGVLAEIVTSSRAVAENKIIGIMNAGDESEWEIYPI